MADSEFDMRDHRRTYEGFIGLTKFSIIAIVILLVLMAAFLV
ncbi:aa3-type cytochrome c oxidase subunit IV [Parapedomonas caeni]